MEAILEVLTRGAPQYIYVCVHEIKGGCVCMSVISPLQQTATCVYAFIYVNTAKRMRLHILLLIMKYFIWKIVSYSHLTTTCNLISK